MKYRSRTEILDAILRSVGSGTSKTQIMYHAYLSFAQLKEYLALLERTNLLVREEGTNIYKLTEKGLRFINAYDEISELIHSEANEITAS